MIVIPMAGKSNRFKKQGYLLPKYMLDLNGNSVFSYAIRSFSQYFNSHMFLFIIGPDKNAPKFVENECNLLNIKKYEIIVLKEDTQGQAETVAYGLLKNKTIDSKAITIFNIDTFRPNFSYPNILNSLFSGWVEVFKGRGDNWSYVLPYDNSILIKLLAEKKPISDLCSTGLYHFKTTGDFLFALEEERRYPQANELYIAPLFNHLIWKGLQISYYSIPSDEVFFCGTPNEYRSLNNNPRKIMKAYSCNRVIP